MAADQDRPTVDVWLQGRGLMVVFTIGSALAFLFVGVLVHLFLADQIRDREFAFDEFHAEFTVESVLAGQLTPADLASPVTGQRYDELAEFTHDLVLIGGVVRVKVWTRNGTVVFSDDPDLVGEQLEETSPALARAFNGKVHSKLSQPDENLQDDPRSSELPDRVLDTYVPLTLPGRQGVQAVGEISQDFAPNEAAAAAAVRRMDLFLGGGLLVLYILLLPLMRRTAGTLQDQTRQLSALLETERATVDRLDELNEMKDLFLTAVSHELRTPLTVVRGVAKTLVAHRSQLPPEKVDELIERLEVNAVRLDELLEDLLDLNRLLRGNMDAQRHPTDVDRVVGDVVERLDTTDHPVDIDAQVGQANVDPGHLERIVDNLVDNALRHTPAGTQIWIRVRQQNGHVQLVVEDAGPGVPPDERDAIFEAFSHGTTATAHSPGTGVGLALVTQLATLHGGRAWVQQRPGGGASFCVTLHTEDQTNGPDAPRQPAGRPTTP